MSNNSDKPLSNLVKGGFFAVFFSTGFSALIFQVIWQRVLTIHAGVDLYSVTTVVAAFMAGLGLGSLLGGYIADRLSVRNCFVFFIISNCVIGIFGFFSLWLFYDIYGSLAPYLDSTMKSFLFHFVLLCIPTTFMGLSLPLLSKALVRTSDEISSLVGSLYGINTLGAAIGACTGTWYIMGTFGFIVTIKIASSINIVCSLMATMLLYGLPSAALSTGSGPIPKSNPSETNKPEEDFFLIRNPNIWILIYGITGFAALSLEIVWFRIINVIERSYSYVFGHFLFIFLCGVGLGSLVASLIIKRIKRPDKFFLWMQYAIGLLSLLSPMVLVYLPESWQLTQFINKLMNWNMSDTFNVLQFTKYFIISSIISVLIFGLPTVLMGVCFPLIQRIVSRQMDTLGRNLSKLLFSNIVGNILGTIVTGFFLLDYFGTPVTLKILSCLLIIPGLIAAYGINRHVPRYLSIIFILFLGILLFTSFPKEKPFWKYFHTTEVEDVFIRENRTSVDVLMKFHGSSDNYFEMRTNGHAFTSFLPFSRNINMSVVGIALHLYHPNPKTGLVIGFGSGNTLYSLALDKRLDKIKNVELSGGQIELLKKESWRENLWQADRIFRDPRIEFKIGDARKFLLHSSEKFDLIEIDPFHPMAAYSGNLFSVEFIELVRQHLTQGGIFCQWIATSRVEKNILTVFPYVIRFGSLFTLASNEPIIIDKSVILQRLENINLLDAYGTEGQYLMDYFTNTFPVVIQDGSITEYPDKEIGSDLFPKDEYFVNNKLEKSHLREPIQ